VAHREGRGRQGLGRAGRSVRARVKAIVYRRFGWPDVLGCEASEEPAGRQFLSGPARGPASNRRATPALCV
jgi:hypothetical protein